MAHGADAFVFGGAHAVAVGAGEADVPPQEPEAVTVVSDPRDKRDETNQGDDERGGFHEVTVHLRAGVS